MLSKRCNTDVRVTNDANTAAIGEMRYGAAKGMNNFIVITLGTGVGSGIVINGEVVYGCDGFAGELRHVTMIRGEEGRLCGCSRRGCLEAYCSATGAAHLQRKDKNSSITAERLGCSHSWSERPRMGDRIINRRTAVLCGS